MLQVLITISKFGYKASCKTLVFPMWCPKVRISWFIPNGFHLKNKKKNEDPSLEKTWSFYPMEWPFP
jgi:hypothetical protein